MRRKTLQLALVFAIVAIACLGFGLSTASAHPDHGCSSCHVPHNATGDNSQVPLWNPAHTTTTLTGNYSNSDPGSLQATMGAPDGASKLCLSCHDGSYDHVETGLDANGDPNGEQGHTFGAGTGMGALANSHPISFIYDTTLASNDGELVDPTTLDADVLDGLKKVQCSSCHDVHGTTPTATKNLRWAYDNTYGPGGDTTINAGFCRNCHEK